MTSSPRFLITGFKPFLHDTLNPSELLVQELAKELPDVQALVLPVSYEASYRDLKNAWQDQGPFSALLMLGQAGGRAQVGLERIAVNWVESSSPDEDGVQLPTGPLLSHAPQAHINEFFPSEWIRKLSHFGPAQVSFSAGTYVCNALYFRVLNELCKKQTSSLFVHLPYLPVQTERSPSTPSMDLQSQKLIVTELLKLWRPLLRNGP